MFVLACLSVLGILSSASANVAFSYNDCNHSPNKIFHLNDAHIRPYPIHIPGTETGDVTLQVLRNVTGTHYRLDVQIQKHVPILGYIPVPCISNVGSCTYDLCTILNQYSDNCPLEIQQSSPSFRCGCPFIKGSYHLNPTAFKIPEISGLWSWLSHGDYKATAHITDTNTHEEVACYHGQATIEGDCIGLACLIG